MLKEELSQAIKAISSEIAEEEIEPKITEPEYKTNGDFTTNIAFALAKKAGKDINEIAEKISTYLRTSHTNLIERVEVKNGFINIWLKDARIIEELGKKIEFKNKNQKINLEFVSANPTGPLTMANGRGGFYGDALANILSKTGHDVTREYYINDAGNQVKQLEESIQGKADHYKGDYIKGLEGKTGEEAVGILLSEIKESLSKAGVNFDVWTSEKAIRDRKELEEVMKILDGKGLAEKKDGAVWLGDNVLIKSDGEATYFLADLAYHADKLIKRKFDLAIDIWGADHHGYIERMKKGIEALGIDSSRLKIIIMQLVKLISGGKEVRMSKRTGEFVTMDELLSEVGLDVARWFFLERSPNTHMDFDLDLAKEKSEKNPVYYVQYAHVRMHGILEKGSKESKIEKFGHEAERDLALKILRFPDLLEEVSKNFQVHYLTNYVYELAQTFSSFYRDVKVIGSEREPELLYLVSKTKETLIDALSLLGISRPEKM